MDTKGGPYAGSAQTDKTNLLRREELGGDISNFECERAGVGGETCFGVSGTNGWCGQTSNVGMFHPETQSTAFLRPRVESRGSACGSVCPGRCCACDWEGVLLH